MKKSTISVFCFLLAGCGNGGQQASSVETECFNVVKVQQGKFVPEKCEVDKEWRTLLKDDYQISLPGHLYKFDNSNYEAVFDSNPTNSTNSENDYRLEISNTDGSCIDSHLGNLETKEMPTAKGKIVWAKMLLLNAYDRFPKTYCAIDAPDCSSQELFEGTCKTKTATYAFCAENNGSVVTICLNQQKDNFELAEQIFSTFRWLD